MALSELDRRKRRCPLLGAKADNRAITGSPDPRLKDRRGHLAARARQRVHRQSDRRDRRCDDAKRVPR